MTRLEEVVRDPCWLPMALSDSYENLSFIRLEREALRAAPFLDARAVTANTPQITLPVKEILQNVPTHAMPPMIFHSAFCCSTLMAKALDQPGTCLALKEPAILMALANAKRMMRRNGRPSSDFTPLFDLVMGLLTRQHKDGEVILIKPTNAANNLLGNVVDAGSNVLLMYANLEDFLISILKKGEACKSFIRTQYNIFTLDPGALAEFDTRKAMTFTDLQIASLVWRHQLELFGRYHRNRNITALRDNAFLSDKFSSLKLTRNTLGLAHTEQDIQNRLESDIFSRDVKFENLNQSHAARAEEAQQIRTRYAAEIDDTLAWAKNLSLGGDILPNG